MEISVSTKQRCEVADVTRDVQTACRQWGGTGLVQVYCPHTTCGVAVNEKYDPAVRDDLLAWLERAVPHKGPYVHEEGNSDAHIKSLLVGHQACLPVRQGTLLLGRWQGIFFMEFDGPRSRSLWVSFLAGAEKA